MEIFYQPADGMNRFNGKAEERTQKRNTNPKRQRGISLVLVVQLIGPCFEEKI
jgi:hypothetical protein